MTGLCFMLAPRLEKLMLVNCSGAGGGGDTGLAASTCDVSLLLALVFLMTMLIDGPKANCSLRLSLLSFAAEAGGEWLIVWCSCLRNSCFYGKCFWSLFWWPLMD